MECREVQARMYESLRGELKAPFLSEVASHLATCGPCRAEFEKIQKTLYLLEQAAPPPLPPDFQQEVLRRISLASAPEPSLFSRIREWLVFPTVKWTLEGLAAAAVVLIAVVLIKDYTFKKPSPLETAPRGFQMDATQPTAAHPLVVPVDDLAAARNKMVALVKAQGGELVRTLPRGNELQVVFRLPKGKETAFLGTMREWGAQNLEREAFRDDAGNWVVVLQKR